MDQETLAAIVESIRAGDDDQARETIKGVLRQYPNTADAWYLAAHLVSDSAKKQEFLERALKIEPEHQQAKLAIQRLAEAQHMAKRGADGRQTHFTASVVLIAGLLMLVVIGTLLVLLLRPAHSAIPSSLEVTAGAEDNGDSSLCAILLQRHSNEEYLSYLQLLTAAVQNNNFVLAGEVSGLYKYCPTIDNFAYAWQLSPNGQSHSQAWQDFQNGWNHTGR
jgi:hypothetical protein